jgi:hypothetical protein
LADLHAQFEVDAAGTVAVADLGSGVRRRPCHAAAASAYAIFCRGELLGARCCDFLCLSWPPRAVAHLCGGGVMETAVFGTSLPWARPRELHRVTSHPLLSFSCLFCFSAIARWESCWRRLRGFTCMHWDREQPRFFFFAVTFSFSLFPVPLLGHSRAWHFPQRQATATAQSCCYSCWHCCAAGSLSASPGSGRRRDGVSVSATVITAVNPC